jgi:DNA-directed RNA polymerase specialized sigma24 family protein
MSSSNGSARGSQSHTAHMTDRDWGRLRLQVLNLAMKLARSRAAAEDLVQEAILRVIDPDGDPWDPATEPELARHLMRIIDNIRRVERAHRKVQRDPSIEATVEERMTPRAPTPEKPSVDAEGEGAAQRRLAAVKEKLGDDPVALKVIEQTEQGVDRPAEQALATGESLDDIRTARKRVRTAIATILRREQKSQAEPAWKASP